LQAKASIVASRTLPCGRLVAGMRQHWIAHLPLLSSVAAIGIPDEVGEPIDTKILGRLRFRVDDIRHGDLREIRIIGFFGRGNDASRSALSEAGAEHIGRQIEITIRIECPDRSDHAGEAFSDAAGPVVACEIVQQQDDLAFVEGSVA